MIKPTVGRVVWYRPAVPQAQPNAAIVVYVHDDRHVNLTVFSRDGGTFGMSDVYLLQDDLLDDHIDAIKHGGNYCEWMPYQKGQAAKTEQLEQRLGVAT
jgi:hypothetical protein